jgi:hypothetical protein
MLKQISTWAEMDLAVWRNRLVLVYIVMRRRKPIVPALKWQPTITAPQSVTDALCFRHRMMRIHSGVDTRQRWRTQFAKQAVDICRNEVEMKVSINFSEVRRLNVAPPELRLWERDTAFEDLRGGGGRSRPVDLIDPSASPSWLKEEIAFCIRHCIANGHDASSTTRQNRLIDFSSISHAHVPPPKATAAFAVCIQTWQRHSANGHLPAESVSRVKNPYVDVSAGHHVCGRAIFRFMQLR